MPRIRLRIRHDEIGKAHRSLYTRPERPGESFEIPVLRLATTAMFGPDPADFRNDRRFRVTAVIDTGAFVSVIDADLSERLDRLGLIEYLPPPAGAPVKRAVIGGGRSAFRLGRVPVALIDRDGPNPPRRLPAVPVIAQLLLDPNVRLPYPFILGLHNGVLDGRTLRREPVMGFEDARYDRTDAGPRFAQQWFLDTP